MESKVRTILVSYNCDDCGEELIYSDGNILLSHPVKIKHTCIFCDKVYLLNHKYPYTKYIEV
jgi:hypothetical protein